MIKPKYYKSLTLAGLLQCCALSGAYAQDASQKCTLSEIACLNNALSSVNTKVLNEYKRVLSEIPKTQHKSNVDIVTRPIMSRFQLAWTKYKNDYCLIHSGTMGLLPQARYAVLVQCKIDLAQAHLQKLSEIHP